MTKLLLCSALVVANAANASLIAQYSFDAPATRYEDVSSNSYNGSGVGTVSFVAGVSGDAMSVAGAGKMVYSAGAGIPVNLADFTLSFWATDSSTSWDSWVEMNAGAGGAEVGIHVQSTSANGVAVYNADGGTPIAGYASGALNYGSALAAGFNHIALTASGGTARLYVGGIERSSTAWTVSSNLGLLSVGGLFRDAVRNVSAQVDDVQIYDTGLAPSEIAFLAANPGVTVPESSSGVLAALGLLLMLRLRS
jgi:hypothetical protein